MRRAVCLLSGGFDSAVATHLMREKLELHVLHCSLMPIVNDTSIHKCRQLAARLTIPLTIVQIGRQLETIANAASSRFYFILQKRFFLRLAEKLANNIGADAIITGDNLGQVSSQTLTNLASITHGSAFPILRPLLTWDKKNIISYAKHHELYDICVGPEMCDALGPSNPLTTSTVEKVLHEESKYLFSSLIQGDIFESALMVDYSKKQSV